ncbi:hypothetical protein CEY11_00490 [Candidimonas nitroreducens]|uniref:Uncharacterized protein n=1 Tax=Candidimonas nitroreducens TaxID=683354 RepID=A0A225N2D0_9BURK|nr:hypothetical protein CEY11_00490 [Candidimonas nitroreducens]
MFRQQAAAIQLEDFESGSRFRARQPGLGMEKHCLYFLSVLFFLSVLLLFDEFFYCNLQFLLLLLS